MVHACIDAIIMIRDQWCSITLSENSNEGQVLINLYIHLFVLKVNSIIVRGQNNQI